MSDAIEMTVDLGGEIQSTIESLKGSEFRCDCEDGTHPCSGWLGNPSPSGVPDKDGNRYLMHINCPNTGYGWSLLKIQDRIVS